MLKRQALSVGVFKVLQLVHRGLSAVRPTFAANEIESANMKSGWGMGGTKRISRLSHHDCTGVEKVSGY